MQDLCHGFARINTDTAKTFLDRVGIRGEFAGGFNLLRARGTVAVGILRLRDCSASRGSSHSALDDKPYIVVETPFEAGGGVGVNGVLRFAQNL
jgi:hypothetical protein